MNKTETKLQNFRMALAQLEEYVRKPVEDNRDKAGVVQAFEFTFEALIRLCQSIAQDRGEDARFPRDSLEAALKLNIFDLEDEEAVLLMLNDRNSTSHLYNERLAQEVFTRVVGAHLRLLRTAAKQIDALGLS